MNEQEAKEVFDGVMLSDGHITPIERTATLNVDLSGIEHIDWLQSIKEALAYLNTQVCANHPRLFKGTSKGKVFYGCLLTSRKSEFITEQRNVWYPRGEKVVPAGITLTPVLLANWFMGDRSSTYRGTPDNILIRFATHKFNIVEISILVDKLNTLGLHSAKMEPDGKWNIIKIHSQEDTVLFMNMVTPYIPESYRYKIKGILQEVKL